MSADRLPEARPARDDVVRPPVHDEGAGVAHGVYERVRNFVR
ncbi:hypothetical protein [Streptomyces sviceus]